MHIEFQASRLWCLDKRLKVERSEGKNHGSYFSSKKQPIYGNRTVKNHFRSYHIVDNKVNTALIYSQRMRKRGGREK